MALFSGASSQPASMFRSRRSQLPRSFSHLCRVHPPTSLSWNSALLSIGSLSESESTCSNVGWVLSRSDTVRLVDVRIGVTQTARELAFEVDDDQRDDLHSRVDAALGGATDVLWVTDRKGREVAIPAAKIAYVELGTSEERRIGFGG